MTSELLPFIFINCMTDIGIRALYCHFAGFRWKHWCCLLLEFNIELEYVPMSISSLIFRTVITSTQSSSSTLPEASTLTSLSVSLARSYEASPLLCRALMTEAFGTLPVESTSIALGELFSHHERHQCLGVAHLNFSINANISS